MFELIPINNPIYLKKVKTLQVVFMFALLLFVNPIYSQTVQVSTPSICTGGSTCVINWTTSSANIDGFKIEIQKAVGAPIIQEIDDFVLFTNGTESYTWTVWNTSYMDGAFQIIVTELIAAEGGYDDGHSGFSSSFTINRGPHVSLTSSINGKYTVGGDIPITYTTNDAPVKVYIEPIGGTKIEITNDISGNNWTIPNGQTEGNYKISLEGANLTSDVSSTFEIEQKRITITYPYDGLVFQRGVAQPVIRWTSNYPIQNATVWVEDGDSSWTIASNTSGNSFIWDIDANFHLDNDFEIYVEDNVNTSIWDVQTGKFTIKDPYSESFTLNSAKSTAIKVPITSSNQIDALLLEEKSESVSFSDGTGKIRQSKVLNISPTQQDVITHFEYNEIGQKIIDYLPYVELSSDEIYITDALDSQSEFYCIGANPCVSSATGVTGNSHPYSRIILEKSPLQTLKIQGAIGELWQPENEHTMRFESHANVANQDIIHWTLDGDGDPVANGYYDASLIAISKTIDENDNESYIYTDREGQEILKEGFVNATTPVRTYYVYDKYGNLRFIIPPEAVDEIGAGNTIELTSTHSIRTTWLTEMQYDGYHRVVWKKIPEAEPVYTVYDKLGRVALTQDGNMRPTNKWFFTKYDIRGRAILTGTYTEVDGNQQIREEMQAHLNNWPGDTWESRTSVNYAEQHGYTFNTFPDDLQKSVIWSVTYYDDYDFNNNGIPDESFEANSEFTALTGNNRSVHEADVVRIDGMVTGSKTRILSFPTVIESNSNMEYDSHDYTDKEVYYLGNNGSSITLKPGFSTLPDQKVVIGNENSIPSATFDEYSQGSWLEGVSFYDKYGRTIYTKSTNHLGGEDKSWTLYHFDGEVERTKQTHTANSITTTIRNRFAYDHTGRLLNQYHKTNNQNEILVTNNSYNELGQLITKKLNYGQGQSSYNYTQEINYSYHLRGWLESVNDPDNLGSDLFGYKLYYDQIPSQGLSNASFNGNIISQEWNTMVQGSLQRHRYDYSYDGLNQLTLARKQRFVPGCQNNCAEWTTQYEGWGTNYSYDLNGNIQSLNRSGETYYSIDALTYSYTGNQIKAISDNGYATGGFNDGASNATEYYYDDNGSMTEDDNKGITNIRYNKMNLPEVITFDTGTEIVYQYDAAGSKLSKKTYLSNGTLGVSTDYVNGYVYTDNTLDFFGFSEGRIRMIGTTGTYEYDLKDHLGNVRATFKSYQYNSASLLQADSYYPFGLKMPGLSYVASGSDENKFTYNGKELEDEFGLDWYHYGARFYDAAVGRWWALDPASQFHSPYLGLGNNPIAYIDPSGEFVVLTTILVISAGAAIGATFSAWQIAKENGGFSEVDWSDSGNLGRVAIGGVSGGLIASGVGGALGASGIAFTSSLGDSYLANNGNLETSDFVFAGTSALLTGAGSKFVSSGFKKLDDILDRRALRLDFIQRFYGDGKRYTDSIFTRKFAGPTVVGMNGLWDLFKFQFTTQISNWIDTPSGNIEIGDFQTNCIGDHCE